MDYDDLLARLREWDEADAADAIESLREQLAAAQARASELATACARERNNVYTMVESCKRAESDLAAARALLREVHNWMPKGNRKLFERIDAAIAGEKK